MMKKLLAATAISVALISTASADVKEYAGAGFWRNYAGTSDQGGPICGMYTRWKVDRGVLSTMHVKFTDGHLFISIFKTNWRIPAGSEVPVEVGVDHNTLDTAVGYGDTLGTGRDAQGEVIININKDYALQFLEDISAAKTLWVKFKAGNEQPWVANMVGSRRAADALKVCVVNTMPKITQPYTSKNDDAGSGTQPFGGNSTTPVGRKPYESDL